MPTIYLHLPPEHAPPALAKAASKFIVIIEAQVSNEWRNAVSDWMVDCGCLYMMAWGQDCGEWDDAVDWANLERFDFEDVPAEQSVMTTWHENEPLDEVFRFSKLFAEHPVVPLDQTIILHIAAASQEAEILGMYEVA
jgi:hypothetical protein